MQTLKTAFNTPGTQPTARIAVDLLGLRVIERIIHALFKPQPSAIGLLDLIHTVVAQGGGVPVV